MDIENISKIEHFSAFVDLSLKEFSQQFRLLLELPEMTLNFDNQTESAEVYFKGVNYTINKSDSLNKYDDNIPENHNFGIVLSIDKINIDFNNTKLEAIGNLLSTSFNTDLLHFRTWFSTGFNTEKVYIFTPNKK